MRGPVGSSQLVLGHQEQLGAQSFFFVSLIRKKPTGALTHSGPGAFPLVVCFKGKGNIFNLRDTSPRSECKIYNQMVHLTVCLESRLPETHWS